MTNQEIAIDRYVKLCKRKGIQCDLPVEDVLKYFHNTPEEILELNTIISLNHSDN